MNIKILLHFLILFAAFHVLTGCGDQALFDELATNRIKVVIKGTYESNDPRPWESADPHYFEEDDSVYIYSNTSELEPNVFMMDIAGISVSSGKHKQYFANYRKTHVAPISDTEPLFDGTGIYYDNDDVRPDFVWQNVNIYIRKMLFDNAKRYSILDILATGNTWGTPENVIDLFHEEKVEGFNFNLAQVISYSDSLRMNYLQVNRIFPLVIPVEDGFIFNNKDSETILEIRLVVKNFTKKYEYEYVDADKNHKLIHYYALSDWLRHINRNEPAPTSDTSGAIGGNLLAVARYYVPGKTADISGTTGVGGGRYVIAVKGTSTGEYLFSGTRPTCDAPKVPRMPILVGSQETNYLEALLQYYLQYETYKDNYDTFFACVEAGTYQPAWDSYDSSLNNFRIPPLVTWAPIAGGGSYTLKNVPAGNYTIWYSNTPVNPGELPSTFTQIGGTAVTITESDFGTTVPGP